MTILKVSHDSPMREAARAALRNAGIAVLELDDWDQADALGRGETALVICDGEAIRQLKESPSSPLPRDALRKLSHDLRTPLSAMAGWLHLMESGSLDAAGLKRAIERIKGNIDEQVRTIDRCLGTNQGEGQRK
ncbi:MAG TPA: histidine kinase dimerization/phospho-acceptor domain-containing protein [Usitatibacteraceae bacterium]|nr:histidine kinase dimerization/phospho-acceptor domain-containing protein [Usitatibacteraceae bacterium]